MTDSQHEVERLSDERLREMMRQMGVIAADPMWADHVELPKARLKWWIATIRALLNDINRKTTSEGK